MSRGPRRHPGLWWLIIGGIIAAYFVFMLMIVYPQALVEGGDGVGFIFMGLFLFGIAATGLLVTGTVLEMRARIRQRADFPQPSREW